VTSPTLRILSELCKSTRLSPGSYELRYRSRTFSVNRAEDGKWQIAQNIDGRSHPHGTETYSLKRDAMSAAKKACGYET
jgi:hypothetical protein